MWQKIIDDYRLEYMNDLFEIKLIFYGLSPMLQFSEFVWSLVLCIVHRARYSTNWDRNGCPGSEIQMYYDCPWDKLK